MVGPVQAALGSSRALNELGGFGQCRGAETEGALDNPNLAADVTADVEGRGCPLRNARITAKPLIVA